MGRARFRGKYGVYFNPLNCTTSRVKRDDRDIFFASQLELNTYKLLSEKHSVETQVRINLKPKGVTPPIDYVCDFKVGNIYIESKGLLTDVSKLKLILLSEIHPSIFSNLIVVISDKTSKEIYPKWLKNKTITLTQLRGLIQ